LFFFTTLAINKKIYKISISKKEEPLPLGGVIFIALFTVSFGLLLLLLASKLGIKTAPDQVKSESYECGIPVQEKKDTKISVKFYLTAILFIIFDIEIIFMYPWAMNFRDFMATGHGAFVLGAMMIFLFVFIFGLFWEVKSKALEWD
jgi:NADH-quinone oxidoreductase subunit A